MRRRCAAALLLAALAGTCAPHSATHLQSADAAPLSTVLACGTYVPARDVVRLLRSAYAALPSAQLLLALDAGSAAALQPTLDAAPPGISVVVYDYHALEASLPPALSNYTVHVRRYHHYRVMLRDAEAGGRLLPYDAEGETNSGASSGVSPSAAPPWVLYRRAAAADPRRRLPARPSGGVLLSDLRDVVFQADPFDMLRSAIAAAAASPSSAPRKPVLIGAAERHGLVVKHCPFNRQWTEACYGDTGSSFLAFSQVLCSGTTLGEAAGVGEYLDALILAATGCKSLSHWEQAVHNFLFYATNGQADEAAPMLHGSTVDAAAALFSAALPAAAGTFERPPDAGPRPSLQTLLSHPDTAVAAGAARQLHARTAVSIVPSEGSWICTLGYGGHADVVPRDDEGWVTAHPSAPLLQGATVVGRLPRCAIVHQYDRIPELTQFYEARFGSGVAEVSAGGGA